MKVIKLLFTVLALGVTLQASAQSGGEQYTALAPGDVDKFLETFKPMTDDLEALEDKLNENGELDEMKAAYSETGDMSEWQELYDKPEVKAILDKYGWDEQYYEKMRTIITGFGVIHLEKEMEEQADEIEAEEKATRQRLLNEQREKVDDASLSMIEARANDLLLLFEADQE
ncbi:hypothetical protein [Tunicatimonas pelagia]|uniref:hypothetical protein n=1 Tax=Tunicatimonas pelagia TaxID=931531 RepID=UPI002665AC3D|nr:hypothetical protein [Tunicatimonas pelagia]WKN46122.1 hypothetical protein P0M28_14300 [Tunicatimonas pelagia]